MELNDTYEKIVELGGDCFQSEKRPPCENCSFQGQCLHKMIVLAEAISKEARLRWALDKLIEEYLLKDDEQ